MLGSTRSYLSQVDSYIMTALADGICHKPVNRNINDLKGLFQHMYIICMFKTNYYDSQAQLLFVTFTKLIAEISVVNPLPHRHAAVSLVAMYNYNNQNCQWQHQQWILHSCTLSDNLQVLFELIKFIYLNNKVSP